MTKSNANAQNSTSNGSAQELMLRLLFERSPDAILMLDGEKFIDCNPAAVEMLRAAGKEQVLDLHPSQLSPELQPDGSLSAEKSVEMMRAAFEEGTWRFEWVHRRVDGEDFPVEVTLTTVPWDGQQVLYIEWRDISKRKQAEKTLQESEEKYRVLIEQLQDGVFVIQEAKLQFVNETFAKMVGYAEDELIGMSFTELVAPEDLPGVVDNYRRRQAGEEAPDEYEFNMLRKDRRTRVLVNMNVGLITYQGTVASMGTVKDITERKQAEAERERLSAILEATSDLVAINGPQGQILYLNQAARRKLGVAEDEEVTSKSIADFTPKWALDLALQESIPIAIQEGVWRGESALIDAGGQEFPVSQVAMAHKSESGEVEYLSTIVRDISEQAALTQQIEESLERRGRQVALSTEVSQEIAAAKNLDELFRQVVDLVQSQFEYYHAHVYSLEEEALVMQEGTGDAGRQMKETGHRIELTAEQSLVARAARSGRPVLVPDVTQEPGWLPNPLLPETKAEIAVPIKLGEQVLGVLDVQNDAVGSLSEEDQLLLLGLCGQIAVAIDQRRAEVEQARLTAELESEQSTLRAILENIPLGIYVAEVPTGKPLLTNQRAEDMLGRGISPEAGTEELAEVYAAYRTGTEEAYPQVEMPLVRGMSGEITVVDDMEIRRPDGSQVMLQVFGAPIVDVAGQVMASVAIFQDITEQKQAAQERARLSAILEATSDFVAMANAEGQSLYVNKAGREMIGIGLDENIMSLPIAAYHPEQVLPFMLEEVLPTAVQEGIWSGENVLLNRDGREIPILQVLIAQKTAEGGVDYFATIARDISGQKQSEALLAKRASELETVAELSTQMASVLDPGQLLQTVVDLTKEGFDLYHAHIYLLNEAGDTLNLAAGAGEVGRQMVAEGWRIPFDREHSLVARSARIGQGVISNDVRQEPDFLPNPRLPDTRAEMVIPIVAEGKVIGVLDVQADVPDRFTNEDVRINTVLASQVAVALQNARLFERSEQALTELDVLTRRLTREGWDEYFQTQEKAELGYVYDLRQVSPVDSASLAEPDGANGKLTQALTIRGETIGQLELAEPQSFAAEAAEIVDAVAERLTAHLENLRLTEQTQLALAEVQQSQEFLRTIIDNIPNPVFFKDVHGAYIGFNKAFLDYFGQTEEALLGKTVYDLNLNKTLADEYHETDIELIRNPGTQMYEAKAPHADGTLRDVIFTRATFNNPDGSLGGLVGAMVDITDRKQAEIELTEATTFMDSIIENLPTMLFVKDAEELRFVRWNRAGEELLGHRREDMVGKNDYDFFPKEEADFFIAKDREVLDGGELIDIPEEPIDTLHQGTRILHTRKLPIYGPDGKPKYLLGMSEDITERKQAEEALRISEERLALALQGSNDGIWDWDIANETLYWSPRLKGLLGYADDELEVDFEIFTSFMHPDDAETTQAAMDAHLKDRLPYDVEQRMRHKSGEYRWFRVRGQAVWNEAGQPIRMSGSTADITESKQAEQALRDSEAQLSEALEIARMAYWELDFHSMMFTFTDQFFTLMNTTVEQEGGYNITADQFVERFVHPEDVELLNAEIAHAMEQTNSDFRGQIEYRLITRDNEEQYTFSEYRIDVDAEGRVIRAYGATRDTTARKRAELEQERLLQEVEGAYRQYVQQEWQQFLGEQHSGRWRIEHQQAGLAAEAGDNGNNKVAIEAPIALRGQQIGSLRLEDVDPGRKWTDEEQALVEAVSQQLAQTVENLRLFEGTRQRAGREQLTRYISDRMRTAPDVDSIIQVGVQELANVFQSSHLVVELDMNKADDETLL